ncbi:hypothetical protein OS493_030108 [Desmophyllum pertusum]|uniref:Uncharacterized protein n=1 Tax=Desmophyllum pertusum TaxID=174260 RepID=A0A9W9Z8T9_9CNID|nr:hypothetical protein OS493_030108 [Desmophyllum pertusum]
MIIECRNEVITISGNGGDFFSQSPAAVANPSTYTFTLLPKTQGSIIPTKDAMPDFKKPYLASIVILLFLIRLGASQHFDGGDTSSTTNDPNTDQTPFNILKKLLEKKRSSSTQGSPKHNITSGVELDDIVTTRFRKEMAMLFSWLPESNQCNIFVTVSKKTQCSVPNIIELLFSLTEMKHNVNVSCPVANTIKVKTCSQANRTFVGDIFCDELLKVFASLPSSFKCHIINTIALAYNPKGRRHLANKYLSLQLSVSQAQTAVASIFPTVSLPLTCANMEMNHLIPSTPPVNITVNLTSADKETWLKALMKKGPEVFKTFLEYEKMIKDKGQVLSPASTEKYLADNEELINSTQLFTVGIDGGSKIFSVLFRLKVKWKQSNRLREMKSTYKIVQALSAKNHKELRTIFNANIISISLSGERSNITKTPPKSNKWSLQQFSDGKDLFPAYLSQYYKQLGKPARCFVVYFISLKIKKSQLEVEMFLCFI